MHRITGAFPFLRRVFSITMGPAQLHSFLGRFGEPPWQVVIFAPEGSRGTPRALAVPRWPGTPRWASSRLRAASRCHCGITRNSALSITSRRENPCSRCPLPHASHSPRHQRYRTRVRRNQYGDPLPPGALARIGTVRFSALSPDGKVIAVTGGRAVRRTVIQPDGVKTVRVINTDASRQITNADGSVARLTCLSA